MMIWIEEPRRAKGLIGHNVVAIHPDALTHAVEELVSVGSIVAHLKVRSGEHRAALLLTAVCGRPVAIDTHGEVDLAFDTLATASRYWPFGNYDRADVEIKSFAGGFRRAESRMQIGESFSVTVRTAADILNDATSQIAEAVSALSRKVGPRTSKNVFMIIHPFDAFVIETYTGPMIGHLLPRLSSSVDLDTLWLLWHPDMLVVWSREDQRWTDILFAVEHEPPKSPADNDLAPLQQAESAFLEAIGYDGGSPWIFGSST